MTNSSVESAAEGRESRGRAVRGASERGAAKGRPKPGVRRLNLRARTRRAVLSRHGLINARVWRSDLGLEAAEEGGEVSIPEHEGLAVLDVLGGERSEATGSNRKQSDAIGRNQTQSNAIRRNQTQSDAIRSTRKQSEAIRSNQKQSEAPGRIWRRATRRHRRRLVASAARRLRAHDGAHTRATERSKADRDIRWHSMQLEGTRRQSQQSGASFTRRQSHLPTRSRRALPSPSLRAARARRPR